MEANKGTQIGSAHLCGSLSIPYGLKVPILFVLSDPLFIRFNESMTVAANLHHYTPLSRSNV